MSACSNCGATLTPEDMQSKACRYCGTVFEHYARAAEKVAVVQQLLAPGPGGVPVALQGMMGMPMQPGVVPPMVAPAAGSAPQLIAASGGVVFAQQPPPMLGGPMPFAGQPVPSRTGPSITLLIVLILVPLLGLIAAGAVVAFVMLG
jgi:hypothetical protein